MIFSAIVIKNFIPLSKKVQILHAQHGKITCVYPGNHAASQLTTGSIIQCSVEPFHHLYRFEYLEIMQAISFCNLESLQFIHEIAKICVKLIPDNVAVSDIFEFVMHVHQNAATLSVAGRKIVLLRLFLMCDLLSDHRKVYQIAMQDPFDVVEHDLKVLEHFVQLGWSEMSQQNFVQR